MPCTDRIMSGLPREVIRWLQSLDLTHPIHNVRRDFSNGFLVAEIFAWYYPKDIQMHSFSNGASIQTKLGNWRQLERFFGKEKLDFPKEFIEGTVHCKPGAANALLERAYTLLTNRELHYLPPKTHPQDFSDSTYQKQLPLYARATTAQASPLLPHMQSIKNNIASTELTTEPDRILCMQKTQAIIEVHTEQRRQERETFPERFGLKTSAIGRLSKQSPKVSPTDTDIREVQVVQKPTVNLTEP